MLTIKDMGERIDELCKAFYEISQVAQQDPELYARALCAYGTADPEFENICVETVNIRELTMKLRALGMKVSEMTLGAGIDQGLYPFAICIHTDAGGKRFEIYKKLLDEWIAERATPIHEARHAL